MRSLLKSVSGWSWRRSSTRGVPSLGITPRNRTRLNVEEFERRDCPSVFNEVHVTNSFSLEQAWAKVNDYTDPDYENQARIIIDEGVSDGADDFPEDDIILNDTLIGNLVFLTHLEIVTEGQRVFIYSNSPSGEGGPLNSFRFMEHLGNDGLFVTFSNLTFWNFGAPTGDGGAILTNAPLTLNNCNFFSNVAGGSGGAIATSTTLSATNCMFGTEEFGGAGFGNSAGNNGGAIYFSTVNGTGFPLTLMGCQFYDNHAINGNGGAVYFWTASGTLTIIDSNTTSSIFQYNTALSGYGGAIYQFSGYIYAVSALENDPETGEGPFNFGGVFGEWNVDSGDGNSMYLLDLYGATIDMWSADPVYGLYLASSNPPPSPTSPTVHVSKFYGGYVSNWPLGWFY